MNKLKKMNKKHKLYLSALTALIHFLPANAHPAQAQELVQVHVMAAYPQKAEDYYGEDQIRQKIQLRFDVANYINQQSDIRIYYNIKQFVTVPEDVINPFKRTNPYEKDYFIHRLNLSSDWISHNNYYNYYNKNYTENIHTNLYNLNLAQMYGIHKDDIDVVTYFSDYMTSAGLAFANDIYGKRNMLAVVYLEGDHFSESKTHFIYGNLTALPHELGHLFGAHHNIEELRRNRHLHPYGFSHYHKGLLSQVHDNLPSCISTMSYAPHRQPYLRTFRYSSPNFRCNNSIMGDNNLTNVSQFLRDKSIEFQNLRNDRSYSEKWINEDDANLPQDRLYQVRMQAAFNGYKTTRLKYKEFIQVSDFMEHIFIHQAIEHTPFEVHAEKDTQEKRLKQLRLRYPFIKDIEMLHHQANILVDIFERARHGDITTLQLYEAIDDMINFNMKHINDEQILSRDDLAANLKLQHLKAETVTETVTETVRQPQPKDTLINVNHQIEPEITYVQQQPDLKPVAIQLLRRTVEPQVTIQPMATTSSDIYKATVDMRHYDKMLYTITFKLQGVNGEEFTVTKLHRYDNKKSYVYDKNFAATLKLNNQLNLTLLNKTSSISLEATSNKGRTICIDLNIQGQPWVYLEDTDGMKATLKEVDKKIRIDIDASDIHTKKFLSLGFAEFFRNKVSIDIKSALSLKFKKNQARTHHYSFTDYKSTLKEGIADIYIPKNFQGKINFNILLDKHVVYPATVYVYRKKKIQDTIRNAPQVLKPSIKHSSKTKPRCRNLSNNRGKVCTTTETYNFNFNQPFNDTHLKEYLNKFGFNL